VTAVPDTGYHFVQWSDGVLTASRTDTSVTADINVTATFAIDTTGPVVTNVIANPNPAPVNTPVTLTATVTNQSSLFPITYTIDGSEGPMECDPVTNICTATIGPFPVAGVFDVSVQAKDGSGNVVSEQSILLAVYDASAGFVTGGGWINSPAGASTTYPEAVGKANFGFVSKYQKGAKVPTGNTEFQFKAGNLNFHSNVYEWLVVAGAKAQYKGTGTINGAGNYGFMLTAIDGQIKGGGGVDKFRIKIWDRLTDTLVYDNQMGAGDTADPTTAIAGGSIVIHAK